MRISSITRTRKNKQFTFSPRYYDQEKEEFEARIADIEAKITGERKTTNTISYTGFKDKWKKGQNTQTFEKKSNIRLLMIVAVLLGLSYWLLYS